MNPTAYQQEREADDQVDSADSLVESGSQWDSSIENAAVGILALVGAVFHDSHVNAFLSPVAASLWSNFEPAGTKLTEALTGGFSTDAPLEPAGTMWKTKPMLILASQSATRKALLAGAGLRFAACPAPIDERALEADLLGKGGTPVDLARGLSEAKALSISNQQPGAVVIGGDQVLAIKDEILHKPADMDAARAQLLKLRGRTHQLLGGIALARAGRLLWSDIVVSTLTLRAFSDTELDRVLGLEGEAVLQSVGAYRFEGPSVRLFEAIDGDYFSILGLPLLPLLAALRLHAPETLDVAP